MTERNCENCAKEQQERLFSKELESLPEDERKAVLEDARQSAKEQQERLFLAQNDLRSKTMTREECEIETSKSIMKMRKHIADLELKNAELKEENKKTHVLFADIIEAFTSCSYNDDFEMAQAGKEIYELFYGGKDPKEVFHNAEVPKCSRQLLVEAKEIIKKLYSHVFQGMGFMELNDYNVQKAEVEAFLEECEK